MRKLVYALLILIVSLVIADYGLRLLQSLPFETIGAFPGYTDSTQGWADPKPGLVIIANPEEAIEAMRFLKGNEETILALNQIDFRTHFVILAFRGRQSTTHTGFEIKRVVRRGDTVVLYAQPGRLPIVGPAMVTSPFHAIKVSKKGRWGQVFTFTLHFGRFKEAVSSSKHFIP